MQWFQVTCPSCTAQLQVRLPEGITSVQCSQCKAVFAVQIQPTALDSSAQPMGSKRSRKRKAGEKDPNAVPRALSAYNVFMKQEVAKVKGQHPEMQHRDAFKMAAERWQASPMNPQNGGARFPVVDDPSGHSGAGASGLEDGGDYDEGGEEEGEEEEEMESGAPTPMPAGLNGGASAQPHTPADAAAMAAEALKATGNGIPAATGGPPAPTGAEPVEAAGDAALMAAAPPAAPL